MKENIDDLMTNQRHILEAIKYLKEQVEDIVKKDKVMNEKDVDVDRILESQAMIDELLFKTCDDILRIKKMKEENADNIKVLDKKIDKIDKKKITRKRISCAEVSRIDRVNMRVFSLRRNILMIF